ncbi:MAG: BA14K family protein [Allorhizobium sp.]
MNAMIRRFATYGITAAVVLTSFLPTQAMVLRAPAPVAAVQSDVVAVDYYGRRHGGPGYYRGHRGYRHERPGYRQHNGLWFPLGAFAAGAVIGGALSQPAPVRRGAGINPRHYDWCNARYRSYDSRSNTFQPNYGSRRPCLSPYY